MDADVDGVNEVEGDFFAHGGVPQLWRIEVRK